MTYTSFFALLAVLSSLNLGGLFIGLRSSAARRSARPLMLTLLGVAILCADLAIKVQS